MLFHKHRSFHHPGIKGQKCQAAKVLPLTILSNCSFTYDYHHKWTATIKGQSDFIFYLFLSKVFCNKQKNTTTPKKKDSPGDMGDTFFTRNKVLCLKATLAAHQRLTKLKLKAKLKTEGTSQPVSIIRSNPSNWLMIWRESVNQADSKAVYKLNRNFPLFLMTALLLLEAWLNFLRSCLPYPAARDSLRQLLACRTCPTALILPLPSSGSSSCSTAPLHPPSLRAQVFWSCCGGAGGKQGETNSRSHPNIMLVRARTRWSWESRNTGGPVVWTQPNRFWKSYFHNLPSKT